MKYLLVTACFFILIFSKAYSQFDAAITGVDFRMENNNIVVNYTITNYLPNQVFNISLRFISSDNSVINPISVYGDIGPGIFGGANKTIVWNAGNDITDFKGMLKAVVTVIVPMVTDPGFSKVQPDVKKEKGTGGPGYAGLSMIFPGVGGYFVEKNTSRAIAYNVLAAAVLTSIIVHNVKLKDLEDQYSAATTTQKPLIQEDIDKTEETLQKAYIVYGVIWVSDILWVTYKGFKNQKTRQMGGFSLNYSGNRLMAGYRVNF